MISDHPNSADLSDSGDILARATQALRDRPIPPGPSPQLVLQAQDSLRRAAKGPMFLRLSTLLRLAAAILILCGAAVLIQHLARNRDNSVPPGKPAEIVNRPNIPPTQTPSVPGASHIEHPTPPPLVKNTNPPPVPTPAAPMLGDGVIAGQVLFDGAPPKALPLASATMMPQCERLHGGPILDESLVVNAHGGLANVVISISDGLSSWLPEEFPPPVGSAVLDQKGCVFVPHVVAVMVGQPLLVKNSDPMLHNVHVMAVNNPPANVGQPSIGETETEKFQLPEVFRVKCDVHPWMEAWVRVVDNPYFAVTGPDGRFSLHGVPPGTYTLKAWHEQLGIREMQVTIAPGHGAAVDFNFPPAPR